MSWARKKNPMQKENEPEPVTLSPPSPSRNQPNVLLEESVVAEFSKLFESSAGRMYFGDIGVSQPPISIPLPTLDNL